MLEQGRDFSRAEREEWKSTESPQKVGYAHTQNLHKSPYLPLFTGLDMRKETPTQIRRQLVCMPFARWLGRRAKQEVQHTDPK